MTASRRILLSIGLGCLTAGSIALAHGPGKGNDFGGRRVLFIGIDGCRADSLAAAKRTGAHRASPRAHD